MNAGFAKPVITVVLWLSIVSPSFSECPSADLTGDCRVDLEDFAIFAGQWLTEGIPTPVLYGVTWVAIDDPGIGGGKEGFTGEMSKYETTNAQYCQFLNAALASGDITVIDNYIYGANGTNSGADFVGEVYNDLAGPGFTNNGATNGGAARIHYSSETFTVDSGFENHPVTYVSWYGASACCAYYGYRLPTEWEWQAVADYDGSFIYGCGPAINNSIANYYNSSHPDGTTAGGLFGTYGYGMCDLAGNVWEWTSSLYDPGLSLRVLRGGTWYRSASYCTVSSQLNRNPYETSYMSGFRMCR